MPLSLNSCYGFLFRLYSQVPLPQRCPHHISVWLIRIIIWSTILRCCFQWSLLIKGGRQNRFSPFLFLQMVSLQAHKYKFKSLNTNFCQEVIQNCKCNYVISISPNKYLFFEKINFILQINLLNESCGI